MTGGFAYSTVCDERTAAVSGARVAAASLLLYLLFAFCSSIALGACVDPFCADAALWEQPSARLLSITPELLLGALGVGLSLCAWRVYYVSIRSPW